MICGSTPSCSTAPLSLSNCFSFQGEQKKLPLLTLPWGRGLQPGSAGSWGMHSWRERSPHTEEHFGAPGSRRGTFLLQGHWGGGKEQPPQCPCPGAVPVSCSALEQPPAGLDSHLISSAVCISTQRISPSQRGLCALDTPNPPLRRGMETDPRAPPGQLSSAPSLTLIPHLL